MVQLKTILDQTDLLVSFSFSQKTPKSKCSSSVGSTEHMIVQRSFFESYGTIKYNSDLVFLWMVDAMVGYVPLYSFSITTAQYFIHEFDIIFFIL